MVVVYTEETVDQLRSDIFESLEDENTFIMPVYIPPFDYNVTKNIVQNAIQSTSWKEYTNAGMRPENI